MSFVLAAMEKRWGGGGTHSHLLLELGVINREVKFSSSQSELFYEHPICAAVKISPSKQLAMSYRELWKRVV